MQTQTAGCYSSSEINSEEEFKIIGMAAFFDGDDDAEIDWEDCFGLKKQIRKNCTVDCLQNTY